MTTHKAAPVPFTDFSGIDLGGYSYLFMDALRPLGRVIALGALGAALIGVPVLLSEKRGVTDDEVIAQAMQERKKRFDDELTIIDKDVILTPKSEKFLKHGWDPGKYIFMDNGTRITVQTDMTLSGIAWAAGLGYGPTALRWMSDANPGLQSPDRIISGTQIKVPAHKVFVIAKNGDTLASIAKEVLGSDSPGHQERIRYLNPDVEIRPGAMLEILMDSIQLKEYERKLEKTSGKGKASSPSTVGGINLDPAALDLRMVGDEVQLDIPANLEILKALESQPFTGFTPTILHTIPIINVPLLFGLKNETPKTEVLANVR